MTSAKRRRWLLGAIVALGALAVAAIVAFGAAVAMLKDRVAQALPTSEMAALRIGWSGVVIEGLRVPGPPGWPTRDALRAERVTVVPRLLSLVSRKTYYIASVTISRPYLSALRSGGKLVALPGLRGDATAKDAAPSASPAVNFREISLDEGVVEIFDATLGTPPLKIRLEQIAASVREVNLPGLRGRSRFELDGIVRGEKQDGHAHLDGWAEIGTRDSSIATQLRSLDLVPFQRYLIQPGEAGVRSGRLDLDLQSEVTHGRLHAPGRITLTGLQLESEGGAGTFMGMSRRAVLAGLAEKNGEISADFVIEGDIDEPDFSLNEALSTRLAYSLAKTLGVDLGGLVKGAGTLGLKGTQGAGDAAKALGGAVRELFEGNPKR
ncbi:MAG TPA: DUF748 domain-containing protein [Myxococcota bacterium]|nr:DUF748 domain-containing protein [Myxococcota bacterium]